MEPNSAFFYSIRYLITLKSNILDVNSQKCFENQNRFR